MSKIPFDILTVQNSKVLLRADGRTALLLEGIRNSKDAYAVAVEMNLENLKILRTQIAKIEQFLFRSHGKS